jgi:hypothetical protein
MTLDEFLGLLDEGVHVHLMVQNKKGYLGSDRKLYDRQANLMWPVAREPMDGIPYGAKVTHIEPVTHDALGAGRMWVWTEIEADDAPDTDTMSRQELVDLAAAIGNAILDDMGSDTPRFKGYTITEMEAEE